METGKRVTAEQLHAAWLKYEALFQESPHGTPQQMNTLLELIEEPKVVLELTEKESRMLMGMIQNPMCDPMDEPVDQKSLRHHIFMQIKQSRKDQKEASL